MCLGILFVRMSVPMEIKRASDSLGLELQLSLKFINITAVQEVKEVVLCLK